MNKPRDFSDTFTQLVIEEDDSPQSNIIKYFPQTFDFIESALRESEKNAVLVHCMAGISRSSTIVAAYLMKKHKWSADRALQEIRKVRPKAYPNTGFLQQLSIYEQDRYIVDEAKSQAYRRFLMQGMASERRSKGYIERLILATSPVMSNDAKTTNFLQDVSPTPLTRSSPSNSMPDSASSSGGSSNGSDGSSTSSLLGVLHVSKPASEGATAVLPRFNQVSQTVKTKRPHQQLAKLRCKKCRRELLTADNVLAHSAGRGQEAFAPHKRNDAFSIFRQHQNRVAETNLHEEAERATRERMEHNAERNADTQETTETAPLEAIPEQEADVPIPEVNAATEKERERAMEKYDSPHRAPLTKRHPPLQNTAGPSGAASRVSGSSVIPTGPECSSYFVEPMDWMRQTLHPDGNTGGENSYGPLDGKISCPRCDSKLGNYSWAGLQCSCGAWITPAFSLHKSKVDEAR